MMADKEGVLTIRPAMWISEDSKCAGSLNSSRVSREGTP